jgi:hypothetical protein
MALARRLNLIKKRDFFVVAQSGLLLAMTLINEMGRAMKPSPSGVALFVSESWFFVFIQPI